MKQEEMTKQWYENLSEDKLELVGCLKHKQDFAVLGNAMPFIEEVATALDYRIVLVKLNSLQDIKGRQVFSEDLATFDYACGWQQSLAENANEGIVTLLLFDIDNADDLLLNKLKSTIENHGSSCFIGLIGRNKGRSLEHTTIIDLVDLIVVNEN